jgi:hypothetical protein
MLLRVAAACAPAPSALMRRSPLTRGNLTVKDTPALLYVFDLPESKAKVVLSLDYSVSRRNAEGKKERVLINTFRSGKLVDQKSMSQPGYVWLIGQN